MIIRLLLLSYVLMMIKPAIPIMVDRLAHKYWQESHNRTVHAHNGSQHVHHELKKASDKEQHDNSSAKLKFETSDYYLHTSSYVAQEGLWAKALNVHRIFYQQYYSQLYPVDNVDPPDLSSCLKNEHGESCCADKSAYKTLSNTFLPTNVHFLNQQLCLKENFYPI